MVRVTAAEVKAIIETDMEDTNVDTYIGSANASIEGWFSGIAVTENMLKEIERWITAHLIAISKERQAREEGAGDAYIKYAGLFYTGLQQTSYGQMAIAIDTTGILKSLAGKNVTFFAVREGD